MQPYFAPYIGYFQLFKEVEVFVLTDDYEFSKGGWINRNRILNQRDIRYLTIPLEASSDYSLIREKMISHDFSPEKLLNLIKDSYRNKPYFGQHLPLIESILRYPERNLSKFLLNSLKEFSRILDIRARIVMTSTLDLDPKLTAQDKIISVCKKIGGTDYINLPGGKSLYDKNTFAENGIGLKFLNVNSAPYEQGVEAYVPNLSILDVIFNLGSDATARNMLRGYSLE